MPAIVENCFSSGVATADAIVSGLAPGRLALTVIVGKSTVGRSLTGSRRYAVMPKKRIPVITSTVVTGRRMNSSEKFMAPPPRCIAGLRDAVVGLASTLAFGVSRDCPSMTTCSPGREPLVDRRQISRPRRPTDTGRTLAILSPPTTNT